MKGFKLYLPALLCLSLLFQGCATTSVEPIGRIDEGPAISPTLSVAAPEKSLKRKVAIARFTNETKYGNSFFKDDNNDRIGKQATDILSSRLAATEKFILLERADIAKINAELAMGNLGSLKIPADFLVVGSISEFGRKNTSDVGVFSRVKKQRAFATVNVRLVDVKTGQIIYSEEGTGEAFSEAGKVMGVGQTAGYDSTLNDQAISAAISKLVSNIVENLMDRPWRSYLLAKQDDAYLISGGATQGIAPGNTFKVLKQGKTITNPQTGLPIELPGQKVGVLQIIQCMGDDPISEVSLAALIEGSIVNDQLASYIIEESN